MTGTQPFAAIYSMAGAQPLQPSFGAMAGDNRQHGRQVAVARPCCVGVTACRSRHASPSCATRRQRRRHFPLGTLAFSVLFRLGAVPSQTIKRRRMIEFYHETARRTQSCNPVRNPVAKISFFVRDNPQTRMSCSQTHAPFGVICGDRRSRIFRKVYRPGIQQTSHRLCWSPKYVVYVSLACVRRIGPYGVIRHLIVPNFC